jgi:hypothetical protein
MPIDKVKLEFAKTQEEGSRNFLWRIQQKEDEKEIPSVQIIFSYFQHKEISRLQANLFIFPGGQNYYSYLTICYLSRILSL